MTLSEPNPFRAVNDLTLTPTISQHCQALHSRIGPVIECARSSERSHGLRRVRILSNRGWHPAMISVSCDSGGRSSQLISASERLGFRSVREETPGLIMLISLWC